MKFLIGLCDSTLGQNASALLIGTAKKQYFEHFPTGLKKLMLREMETGGRIRGHGCKHEERGTQKYFSKLLFSSQKFFKIPYNTRDARAAIYPHLYVSAAGVFQIYGYRRVS
jgi:hypothetical protein